MIPFSKTTGALLLGLLASGSHHVTAQAASEATPSSGVAPTVAGNADSALSTIVVNAGRTPQPAGPLSATVSVVDRQQMEEQVAASMADALRYEPGVVVRREPRGRSGEASIEVRGIGGQRLVTLIDGVRQPSGYVASGATQGQLKVDVASLQGIEILRGPASSLYGSDALAGVVLLRTLSPDDFLKGDDSLAGSAATGFGGADNGRFANLNLAFRAGITQNLISVTTREGSHYRNNDSDLRPDPQDSHGHDVLLKSVIRPDSRQTITLTAEQFRRTYQTDQESLVRTIQGGVRVLDSKADDDSRRNRLGLAYAYAADHGWLDTVRAQVDYQRSTTHEHSFEERKPPGAAPALNRDSLLSHRESQWSATVQAEGAFDTGAVRHQWLAGIDGLFRDSRVYHEAAQWAVGRPDTLTHVVDGETYPRKTAPDASVRNIGLFLQDEMLLLGGRLRITPSLRFDDYRLRAKQDALFANANVQGHEAVGLTKRAFTPRLGVNYEWAARQFVYANYVTGFRMPTSDQLNRVGLVPVSTFIHDFIPSPDLQPETSRGLELGLRGQARLGSYELTGFYNRYRDFIETEIVQVIPAGGSVTRPTRRMQARNVHKVDIYGIEAKGHLQLDQLLGWRDNWRLTGAFQWSVGNNKTDDQPLNSIQPLRLVLGLRWDHHEGRYGAHAIGNFVKGKTRVNEKLTQTGPTAPVPLTTGGYATMDLEGYVRLGKQVTLNLAIENVFDRRYFEWSSVSMLTGNDARLAAYTAPGRRASASVRVVF